jgi:hypothetical protein
MTTLADVKRRLAERETVLAEPVREKTIKYDQAVMWQTLKYSTKKVVPISMLDHNNKQIVKHTVCPICGSENMHHIGVELFNRHEDSENGEHIQMYVRESHAWRYSNIEPPDHSVDDDMKNNPSERRSGISIKFICEECEQILELTISQHKGQSLMHWRYNE